MQFGWVLRDPFMQFPGITQEESIKLQHALPKVMTIYEYAVMDEQARKQILDQVFSWSPAQYEEHLAVIKALPLVKVTLTAGVPGVEKPCVGDVLNCKLRVEFLNLAQGEQSGYVHSRTYPYLRRDCWYLIITERTMTGLAGVEKLPIDSNVFEKEFSERITRTGPIEFVCIVCNDSYKGLDQLVSAKVVIEEADPNRQDYEYQQEDLDLMKDAKKKEEEADTCEDSDGDRPEIEQDKDELVRRLKRRNLDRAASEFEAWH